MLFLGILSIQCKIWCNRMSQVTLGDQQADCINLLATRDLFQYAEFPFGYNFEHTFYLTFYAFNLC